jgi:hypothetical protein
MQAIGKGVEQAGEFMLPGGAEEKAVSMLPKGLQMAGKIGAAAIGSGAVNKAQGGDFGTGAAAGAGGSMIGAGLKTVAPKLAESALGITKADRAFGKTPGEAIINETKGIRPGTIADSANSKLGSLTPELESAAANASGPAHLTPARDVVSNAQKTATKQNAASLHGQLQPMSDFLSKRFDTGKQIPSDVAPSELLDLKRGMSKEFLGHWNPETHADTLATGRKAYGALDSELDRTVPAAAGINQRISSLIPVAHRAESTARNAPVAQKMIGRFAAPTGALAGGLFGGEEGYRHGGLPGAVAGAAGGLAAPLLIATPEGQMVMARTLNHAPAMTPALTGAALQLNRKKENQ